MKRSVFIQNTLDELFPNPEVPLVHKSPFTLLVAVVLSAQCTDKKVNEITPQLFEKAPTPLAMYELGVDEILSIIRPCGLAPTKSKSIWALSKIILDKYDGQIPTTIKELETLPGVGHKTASVVAIQALSIPAFPIDTHIHRCAKRWGLTEGKNVAQTERDLKKIFPKKNWDKLHLQIIFYGRAYCPARGHIIEQCPICRSLIKK